MSVPTLTKQPSEDRTYEFDFSDFPEIRDNGETITSAGSVSSSPAGLTLGTPTIAAGAKKVLVRISGGTVDINYKITVINVTTSGSNKLEGEGLLLVRNI